MELKRKILAIYITCFVSSAIAEIETSFSSIFSFNFFVMLHRIKGRKLGRNSAHRKAMMRNLSIAIIG